MSSLCERSPTFWRSATAYKVSSRNELSPGTMIIAVKRQHVWIKVYMFIYQEYRRTFSEIYFKLVIITSHKSYTLCKCYELYTLSSFSSIAYVIHNPFTGTGAIMECNCVNWMQTAIRDISEYVASVIWRWSLQWRHNGQDGVSNYQLNDYLLNRLYKAQITENI